MGMATGSGYSTMNMDTSSDGARKRFDYLKKLYCGLLHMKLRKKDIGKLEKAIEESKSELR